MLKPVQVQDTAEVIAEQIIRLIRDGVLKPGDKLPNENDLMEQFGVGRSSVREAKRVLATKGIIWTQAGRGTFICELGLEVLDGELLQALLGRETLFELQEARDLLEYQIVSLAAQRATDQDLQALQNCLTHMKDESPGRWYEFGLEFHRTLAAASHNRVLVQLYDVIAGLLIEYQRPLYVTHREAETEIQAHWMLFDAIRRRDMDQACQLMRGHMAEVREFMLPFFEEQRNYSTKSEVPSSSLKKRNLSRS
jgi:GntR family transcriptional repressor for pyruvate dehydrogenase complex